MADFGVSGEHLGSQEKFYAQYKQVMVAGFDGDHSTIPVFAICLFLMTNDANYSMITGFLRRNLPWFEQMRAKPYKRATRIVANSLYDILVGVMPVVVAVADY